MEKRLFNTFKERAITFLDFLPRSEWEWLALAQHHGLPTRLLDWSRNPLIALYFAVEEETESDSVVYANKNRKKPVNTEKVINPLNIPKDKAVRKYIPAHLTKRIIAQNGLFTIHPEPAKPFEESNMDTITIPNGVRKEIKQQLYKYGVHRASIYPGLDGLSSHLKWMNSTSYQ